MQGRCSFLSPVYSSPIQLNLEPTHTRTAAHEPMSARTAVTPPVPRPVTPNNLISLKNFDQINQVQIKKHI